jgi:prepilin-type N-terminal cleavage/methylation domain-containing protein/prepilin-type processing-associated H-X9-DG protein
MAPVYFLRIVFLVFNEAMMPNKICIEAYYGVEMIKKKGFTLVELLVVISIIALLLSVLMPALGRARDQARRVACGAQIKNVGLAILSYASANNGYFPESYLITANKQVLGYNLLIDGKFLAKEDKVWVCPGDRNPITVDENFDGYPNWSMPKGKYSYLWNIFLGYRCLVNTSVLPITNGPGCYKQTCRNASRVVVLRDRFNPNDKSLGYYRGAGSFTGPQMHDRGTWRFLLSPNHMLKGYNILFADGHVAFVMPSLISNYIWQLGNEQVTTNWDWRWQ